MNKENPATPIPRYLKEPMLVPKYVTQFQCIGSDCPDTCCATWSIDIDQDTYDKYRNAIQPDLQQLIQTFLVQNDKESYARHGRMNLRAADSHCGLHGPDGKCAIQKQMGEDALSDTCYTYPRNITKIGVRFEQCLSLSCPEAARLALTQDDAFDFVSAEFTARLATTPVFSASRGCSIHQMDEIRFFCIQLFQTDALSNTERLAAIGWVCQQLDSFIENNSQSQIESLIAEMTELVEKGGMRPIVSQLNRRQDASVTLFAALFKSKAPNNSTSSQKDALKAIQTGLGIDANLDWKKIEENYARGKQLLSESNYERLMCRYLLNDVVREIFPWQQATAMTHYRRLLTRYGILRLMLSGQAAAAGRPLQASEMIRTVQIFCRFYQHNSVFAKAAEDLMASSNWTQLEHLYALLN